MVLRKQVSLENSEIRKCPSCAKVECCHLDDAYIGL